MIKIFKELFLLPPVILIAFIFLSAKQQMPVEEVKIELSKLIDKNLGYDETLKEFDKFDLSNNYSLKELHEIFNFDDPRGIEMAGFILNEIQKVVSKKNLFVF